jgi:hypothetical protein
MSRPIFDTIHFFSRYYNFFKDKKYIYGSIIGYTTCTQLGYVLTTEQKKNVYIVDKYLFTQNGYTNFMIIDNYGKHYNVNNSFWYWKWDSIEDWHKIQLNKKITIKYYGYRISTLGLFPNVVSVRML